MPDSIPSQYALITDPAGVRAAVKSVQTDGRVHALDFETTGLRPEDAKVRLTCICGPAGSYVIDHFKSRVPFADIAADLAGACVWAVFNAGFEGRWFDHATGGPDVVLHDVGVMSKAKLGGRPLALADMVKRDLKKQRDNKHLQTSDWSQEALTQEQYDYGFEDAEDTFALWQLWDADLSAAQKRGFAVLNDAWRATAEMEDTGMLVDAPYHQTLIRMWSLRRDTAERVLRKFTPESVIENLRSKKQLSDFLKGVLDETSARAWPATAKHGQLQTTRAQLRQASYRAPYPFSRWLSALMVFNRADKYLSTYGETLLTKQSLSQDGRVHGRFNIAQAVTARYSSCIPAYIPVTLPDRSTALMGDVRPGDFVLTHTLKAQRVVRNIYSGVANVYRIYLETGEVLDCTSNHRLLTDQGWQSLEDYYGRAFDTQPKDRGDVFVPGEADDEGGVRGTWRKPESGALRDFQGPAEGPAEVGEGAALFQEQRRLQESYEREVRRSAPQLCGGGVRPQGLFYGDYAGVDGAGAEAGVSASRSHVQGTWLGEDTGRLPCPPHQQRQDGQPFREFSPRVRRGARGDTPPFAKIRRLEFVGTAPVFDLEVETDHSFIAGGIFVHNSNPNLQNIPRSPVVRRSFIAPAGTDMVLADYSGVELRVLAEVSNDAQLKQDVIFGDVHAESAITLFRQARDVFLARLKAKDPAAKEMRSKAKAFSFQLTYGAGNAALAVVLRCSDNEAAKFVEAWANRYPSAYALRYQMFDRMMDTGFLPVHSGRTIFVHRNDRSLPVAANYPIQAAAADVMYRAVTRMGELMWQVDYPARVLASIHDELLLLCQEGHGEDLERHLQEQMRLAWLDIFPGSATDNLIESAVGKSWAAKP